MGKQALSPLFVYGGKWHTLWVMCRNIPTHKTQVVMPTRGEVVMPTRGEVTGVDVNKQTTPSRPTRQSSWLKQCCQIWVLALDLGILRYWWGNFFLIWGLLKLKKLTFYNKKAEITDINTAPPSNSNKKARKYMKSGFLGIFALNI